MWLLQQGSENRMLVFSTWLEVLDVVGYALKVNAVPHAYVRGPKQLPKAIARLQQASDGSASPSRSPRSKAVRVLLLPIKHGANGLNLTGRGLHRSIYIILEHFCPTFTKALNAGKDGLLPHSEESRCKKEAEFNSKLLFNTAPPVRHAFT